MIKYIFIFLLLTSCSELLILSSGAGVVVSQSPMVKAYNGSRRYRSEERKKMNCWHCNNELIWGGDHDMEDDEDYDIVTNLSCPKCHTHVDVYHPSERLIKEYEDYDKKSKRNKKKKRKK